MRKTFSLIFIKYLTFSCILFNLIPICYAAVNILAAENVYGNVVEEIGGPYVKVTSILNNPSQDPHMFQLKPSIIKRAADADFIIYNGAGYDPWMQSLLDTIDLKQKKVLSIAKLMNTKPGSNPHLWYLPTTLPTFAKEVTIFLITHDPHNKDYYNDRLKRFLQKYGSVLQLIVQLRKHYQNTPVIATEPIFNYMTDSIGLKMHSIQFQFNLMNGIPPTIFQIKQFEDDLRKQSIKVFIYNNQVINSVTDQMRQIAIDEHIPIVGINETMPDNINSIAWIISQLNELEQALKRKGNGNGKNE